jgi:hypothetical protein
MKIFNIIQKISRNNRFSRLYEGKRLKNRFKTEYEYDNDDSNVTFAGGKGPLKPREKWVRFKTEDGRTVVMKREYPLSLKDAREIMSNPFLTDDEKIHKLKSEGASDSMIRMGRLMKSSVGRTGRR